MMSHHSYSFAWIAAFCNFDGTKDEVVILYGIILHYCFTESKSEVVGNECKVI